jgi:predicted DNA-binding protein (MmcQ/YjbR family)
VDGEGVHVAKEVAGLRRSRRRQIPGRKDRKKSESRGKSHRWVGLILSRMDVERIRTYLLGLPHVVETMQWGDNLVFWVGDKAVGGKMFCLVDLDARQHGVISFSAGPERFAELVEVEGMKPAPYMARIHWVAAERWDVLRNAEWESELRAAHAITLGKLPKGVLAVLKLPERELGKLIAERRKVLAGKAAAEVAAKATATEAARKGKVSGKSVAVKKAAGKKVVGKKAPGKRGV